jgi:peptide/nickel transport system substrate-binding protein
MPEDASDSTDRIKKNPVSRRRFLTTTGVAGAAGLAGCASENGSDGDDGGNGSDGSESNDSDGGGGNDSDGTGEQPQGEPLDETWTWYTQTKPDRIQFNPYNPKSSSTTPYDPLAYFNTNTSEWLPNILSDWSKDGETVTVTIDDRFKWHNGEQVTGEDLTTYIGIEKYFGNSIHEFLEDWSADGQTVEFTLTGSNINQSVFYDALLNEDLPTYRKEFKPLLEGLQSAEGDEDALSKAKDELLNKAIQEPVGNSPYKLVETTDDRLRYEIFEDYPFAGEINYPYREVLFAQSDQQRWLELTKGELDGHGGFGVQKKQVENRPERVDVFNPQENACVGHFFQHDDEWLGKREVRLALAHVIDMEAASNNSNSGVLSQYSGIPIRGIAESWLGDSLGDLTDYGSATEENKTRAAELLRQAGLTKQSGTWTKPSGDPLRVPLNVISGWNVAVLVGQTIVQSFQSFGIKSELITEEGTAFFSNSWTPGEFKMIHVHTGFGGYHPYFYYLKPFKSDSAWSMWNPPEEVEVPSTFGDPTSSLETMNVGQKVDELRAATDTETEKQLVKDLAWAFNQSLPYLISMPYSYPQFLTNDEWSYPADDGYPKHLQEVDEMYRRAGIHEFIQKRGIVKARTE